MPPLTDHEIEALRALLAGDGALPGLQVLGQLRVDNIESQSALFVNQLGAATAVHFVQQSGNPVLKTTHQQNKCCIECSSPDPTKMRDIVEAKAGDGRFRQLIAHTVNVSRDPRQPPGQGAMGEVKFQDPQDARPSPEFYWALMVDSADNVHLGNPARPRSVRVRVAVGERIDFEQGGQLVMRIDDSGIHVRGPVKEDLL